MMNATLFGKATYHLIPSFFRTMMYLKKQKREFSVVFHSANGQDTTNVVYEFNRFCAGEHPAFNGRNNTPLVKFDGSKNCKEMGISAPAQKGVAYRPTSDLGEAVLVQGDH